MSALRLAGVALLSIGVFGCGDSESAREAKAMQGAIP